MSVFVCEICGKGMIQEQRVDILVSLKEGAQPHREKIIELCPLHAQGLERALDTYVFEAKAQRRLEKSR